MNERNYLNLHETAAKAQKMLAKKGRIGIPIEVIEFIWNEAQKSQRCRHEEIKLEHYLSICE